MKTGYLLIADILGFGNIIKNVSDEDLKERISDWTDLIKILAKKYNFNNFQLLSDTLFLSVEKDDEKTFDSLIQYCQELIQGGLTKSIPIKGAITYGKYEWGDFIYGKAVIEGHDLESRQNWIGITLSYDIPNLDKYWSTEKIICYPAPLKSGLVQLFPVIAWDVPEFSRLLELLTQKGLTKKGEFMSWPWAEKVKNTYEFKLYLYLLKKIGASSHEFHGLLPIEIIGMNLKF